jgi:hypothetical protein
MAQLIWHISEITKEDVTFGLSLGDPRFDERQPFCIPTSHDFRRGRASAIGDNAIDA